LSALPHEIEIDNEEEGRIGGYHHLVIKTNADQYRELIPWQAIGTMFQ